MIEILALRRPERGREISARVARELRTKGRLERVGLPATAANPLPSCRRRQQRWDRALPSTHFRCHWEFQRLLEALVVVAKVSEVAADS